MMLPPCGSFAHSPRVAANSRPTGHAVNPQIVQPPGIGEDERADGVARVRLRQHARRGADAAIDAEGDHPRSRADAPLRHWAIRRFRERAVDVLGMDVPPLDVIQVAVVALHHDRIDARRADADGGLDRQHVVDQRVRDARDIERVRQQDRRLDCAEFVHLHEADGLAEAIDDMAGGGHFLAEEIAGMRAGSP